MRRVLVTGGAGFLGWHVVRRLLDSDPGLEVVNLDLMTYAGSPGALRDLSERFGARHRFVPGDVRDPAAVGAAIRGAEAVVHLAAESHVDRSIRDAAAFVDTNVRGTQVLLDASLTEGVEAFVQVSTDEVYGHLPLPGEVGEGSGGTAADAFRESDPLAPRSPYAASKAAGDLLALASYHTHGLPVVVTRGCNAFGPGQYPEKLVPLAIRRIQEGLPVPLYGSGAQVREWMHADDQAAGILAALDSGRPGRIYNLGGGEARTNLALVRELLRLMGAPADRVEHVPDRPGHDLRYAMDWSRSREELGWRPRRSLGTELPATVEWYRRHGDGWWDGDWPPSSGAS